MVEYGLIIVDQNILVGSILASFVKVGGQSIFLNQKNVIINVSDSGPMHAVASLHA